MEILIYIVPLLFLGKMLNYFRVSNEILKTENKLVALNNRLRYLAITEQVNYKSDGFAAIDLSICSFKNKLKESNILHFIFYYIKNDLKNKKLQANRLDKEIKQNKELSEIYNEFVKVVANHFISKSIFSIIFIFLIFGIPLLLIKALISTFRGIISLKKIKRYKENLSTRIRSLIVRAELDSNDGQRLNIC